MAEAKSHAMEKSLGLLDVYAITTAGFFSAGFFVLPALAYDVAGPLALLAYPFAALLMAPSMMSLAELATALPRAGGPYFFLDRSLGPAVGTIGGMGTWLALVLKSCFAFIGLGAYLAAMPYVGSLLPTDEGQQKTAVMILACVLTVGFAVLNIVGAKETTKLQNFLVMGLFAVLALFISAGVLHLFGGNNGVSLSERFMPDGNTGRVPKREGPQGLIAAVGLVFFTSVGIIKLASVSEEIARPGRNIPIAIGLSIVTATLINATGVFLMIAAVDPEPLSHSYVPAYAAATEFFTLPGQVGLLLICLAAVAAFAASGNAGILGASRYPLAMSRDRLIGAWFGKVSPGGAPVAAIVTTAAVMIAVILIFDAKEVAKLASAFVLVVFALMNLAVIVMRQAKIESYDPQFRSPLYPWTPVAGLLVSVWLISQMGSLSLLFSVGVVVASVAWYAWYASDKVERHGAIFHWFALLGKNQHDELDAEFRQIMVEKGARREDPFDDVVTRATVIEAPEGSGYHGLIELASESLAKRLPRTASFITEKFVESGNFGFAPMAYGAVLPHFRSSDIETPELVIVRSGRGFVTSFSGDTPASSDSEPAAPKRGSTIHAMFLLVSPQSDPGVHLRILAHLAGRLEKDDFMPAWLAADSEQTLKEILLRDERFVSIPVDPDTPGAQLADQPLHTMALPEDVLVAMVRRRNRVFVPRGNTVLRIGDRLTVIGEPNSLLRVARKYAPPSEVESEQAQIDRAEGRHEGPTVAPVEHVVAASGRFAKKTRPSKDSAPEDSTAKAPEPDDLSAKD